MGWLIALAALAVLAFLPLGVRFNFSDADKSIRLLIGPFSLPLKQSKKQKRKPKKEVHSSAAPQNGKGGGLGEFIPYAEIVWNFLQELRCRIRVRVLQFHLIMASGDPCDLGITYGNACAALKALEPQLDRFLNIKEKDLRIDCDFTAEQSLVYARADVTISFGRALMLLSRYGLRGLGVFRKNQNRRKGGMSK